MDPRIARTRRSLQRALVELAGDRDLDTVTVADIVHRAEVNRSSFYQHYPDKETLLADAIEALLDESVETAPAEPSFTLDPPAVLTAYFRHIEQNVAVYQRVFAAHGSALALGRLRERIDSVVRGTVARRRDEDAGGVPTDVLAAGISGAAVGVLGVWLQLEDRPSGDVAAGWLWELVLGPRGRAAAH